MPPQNAILLVRISDDKAGDAHGVANQERRGRSYAASLNWRVGRVIVENDTSAFKRKKIDLPNGRHELRTVRPGFRLALDLLMSGTHDGLLAIDLDRAARDPRDLEDLIDVVESRSPRIPVESVSGSLRLADDSGVTMARVMVAIANKSSRDTSRRLRNNQEDLAENGLPSGGGHRAYGYARDGLTVIDHEASVIDWMAERVLDEDDSWSLSRIARDLTERKIPTAKGLPKWSEKSVVSIITGPRVAGLRRYRGQIAGKAAWPAILDQETWERVCATLSSRAHGKRSNQLKRWLTGVLVCGLCGRHLIGARSNQPGQHRYWCAPPKGGCGKIAISAERAELEIKGQILEFLTVRSNVNRIAAAQEHVDVAKVRRTLAEDEAQMKELAAEWAHKRLTLGEYREARTIIEARVEQAQSLLLTTAPRAVRRILQADDIAAEWEEFTPVDKRDLVLACVKGYRVLPYVASGPRRFDPDRLEPISGHGGLDPMRT